MKAWQGLTAKGPAEMGLSFLTGDEPPKEIITFAYGMEKGLNEFYATLAKAADDAAVKEMFTKLAAFEARHQSSLFDVYLTLDPAIGDKDTFESEIASVVMEGGFTPEEFLEQNRDSMGTVPDLLNVAMMLEAQALDLYLRYSQKIDDDEGKAVLYGIADDEKAHLEALGRLMEERS
jgi:rubrerythrin